MVGGEKKVKIKTSYALSNNERQRLLEKEEAIGQKTNRGIPMSESCKIPGPGAYKPQYSQIDKKTDAVSHTLRAKDKRQTFFDGII